MPTVRRRYTTVNGRNDWLVSASFDERALDKAHWFEAKVSAVDERTGEEFPFPPEIKTYRIGEVEHTFRDIVRIDWAGDREAALDHFLNTIYRRVYSYIERGH